MVEVSPGLGSAGTDDLNGSGRSALLNLMMAAEAQLRFCAAQVQWGKLKGQMSIQGEGKLFDKAGFTPVQNLRVPTDALLRETGPVLRPIRFNPAQAIRTVPDNLQLVTEEGVFQGTYRSVPGAEQHPTTHYILNRGNYYQVKRSPHFDTLCLVDARRPDAFYQPSIVKMANGKWAYHTAGLRAGKGGVRNLGRLNNLRGAFPDFLEPQITRGAQEGEAVLAKYGKDAADNYLFSLNAQSCVIASLYNPFTQVGAVIHFDHNITRLIKGCLKDVIKRLGGEPDKIHATLVGGDWLSGGADIGGPVRTALREGGLNPTWDYWSYSSCLGNTYGVCLDLRSGVTTVFKTSQNLVADYYFLAIRAAQNVEAVNPAAKRMSMRFSRFMDRVKEGPLVQGSDGVVRDKVNKIVKRTDIEKHEFSLEVLKI